MVLLSSFLDLPARLRLEDDDDDDAGYDDDGGGGAAAAAAQQWRKGMLDSWQTALHPLVPSLTAALLLGMLGTAPETTLDALCQLLRALLLRFPDGVLGLLQPLVGAAAGGAGAADAQASSSVDAVVAQVKKGRGVWVWVVGCWLY